MTEHLFVIGAQRSGSTYLYGILDAHPAIVMAKPVRPEPKYFLHPESLTDGYAAYIEKHFHGADQARCFGEKSTSYIEREDAAQRIARMLPQSRILVILRDPVERALSNYYFSRSSGLENLDLKAALLEEPSRLQAASQLTTSVSPYAYVSRGRYVDYLDIWCRYFPASQVKILIAESFIGNALEVQRLYQWLGLDEHIQPDCLRARVNQVIRDAEPAETERLKNQLAEQVRPWNVRLEQRYGLDLTAWRGMRQ